MLWRIFRKAHPLMRRIYFRVSEPPVPNLKGERDLEYSWILTRLPSGPGRALNFGSGSDFLGLAAARRGFETLCLDLESVVWPYVHPRLRFAQGDLLAMDLQQVQFSLVISCSAIEHVGLLGRYGTREARPNGDLEAMRRLRDVLGQNGVMLLTLPVGRDQVFAPWHRVYGGERLPRLLDGFHVALAEYWRKDPSNRWIQTSQREAVEAAVTAHYYNLGLFDLRKI